MLAPTGAKFGWLNTLNRSAWNRDRKRSVNGKSRCKEKSSSCSGNPRTLLRPALPEIAWPPISAGVQKAPLALLAVGARHPADAVRAAVTAAVFNATPPGQPLPRPAPAYCHAQ